MIIVDIQIQDPNTVPKVYALAYKLLHQSWLFPDAETWYPRKWILADNDPG